MKGRVQPISVNTLLEGAGIFIWPLGVCSLLVVFLVLERALALMPGKVAPDAVLKLVREGRAKELNSESADSAAGRLVLRWKEGASGEVLKGLCAGRTGPAAARVLPDR